MSQATYAASTDQQAAAAASNLRLRSHLIAGEMARDWTRWAALTGDADIIALASQLTESAKQLNAKARALTEVERD